jgi:hypothetical protein
MRAGGGEREIERERESSNYELLMAHLEFCNPVTNEKVIEHCPNNS